MSGTDQISDSSPHGQVTWDLVVNGKPLDAGYQVMSLAVTKEANRIPVAVLVLRDGDAAQRDFPVSNTDDFIPGNHLLINLGRDSVNTQVFKGMIFKHRVRVRESGLSELVVECRDESAKMSIGRHSRYHENSKDSDVMERLIGGYGGLTAEVDPTELEHEGLVQYHCTDWDFVLSRAEVNGLLVLVDDGKVQIKKPDTAAAPSLEASYGSNLLEFEAEMDARTQWNVVDAQAWDYSNQALFESTSDSTTVAEPGNIPGSTLAQAVNLAQLEFRHGGQVLVPELQQWTDAAMLKSRLAKICGRAKFLGTADIKPGQTIDLQGVGDRFNGKAWVSGVRHTVGNGAWDTHVQFGLDSRWFHESAEIEDAPAAGLLPAVNGLQIGKVVQLQDDPDGQHRILVRLPIVDNQAKGTWVRVASLDAGTNRGAFFRPEIDDEVIIGFVNNDPRDAIVLGMLHSSAKPAPITAQDTNPLKGFVTRSDLRVLFHDDTKKITISTPATNSIELDEQSQSIVVTDQNGNTIKMEPSGITLDSPGDITIKAGGQINITATAGLTLGAAQISLTAQGQLQAQGASVGITGSGVTQIQGSLVTIN